MSRPIEPNRTPSLSSWQPLDTVADLLAAAARQGLHVTTDQADFDRSGLDFLVVHACDAHGVPWIVRTPRRAELLATMRTEARVLALVAPRLPVAVPEWRIYADDVIAYPRLEGVPAVSFDPASGPTWHRLDPAAPGEAFVDGYAAVLAALQAIEPLVAVAAGTPTRTIAEVRSHLRRAADETRAVLAPGAAVWARWQRWLDDDAGWPAHVALVHGDLHPGHMLLDEAGRLTGVLDWTEAQVTDPSIDLAMYFGCFGRAALETLVARFERRGGRTWPGLVEHAAVRWSIFPALAAEWALRTGNDGALEFARTQLAQAGT